VLIGATLGAAIVVAIIAAAIWILRQPTYRYLGDPTPAERRSFRETMVTWLIGGRG
jgi:hypothetical protein